jgi:long-chain acyl-CoA synthetase
MQLMASQSSTIAEMFRRRVALDGDLEAYRTRDNGEWHPTTWSSFAEQADALCAGFSELGFGSGDAAAILGACCPAWCLADLAVVQLGGMSVGIYPNLLDDQTTFILRDCKAKVVFVQGRDDFERMLPLLAAVDSLESIVVWDHEPEAAPGIYTMQALQERGRELLTLTPTLVTDRVAAVMPEEVALVVYTSGTTGQPKGVPLTHNNVISGLQASDLLVEEIGPEDITMSFLPMAHVAEHVPGFYGRINVGLRTAYATNYETLLDELLEVRPTWFGAVPRIFEKMYGRIHEEVAKANPRRQAIFQWAKDLACRRGRSMTGGAPLGLLDRIMLPIADKLIFRKIRSVFGGRVKGFVTGSAPINVEILEFFTGVGMRIIEVYGLSEACAISFANTIHDVRLGTVGKALPGIEYRLADDGEILLRGPTVFSGYLNLPESNAEVFDEDGYLRTGDIGVIDEGGWLRITDRKKNLLKTAGGKYVAPARLEAFIKEEPIVSQVYVHGDLQKYVVALVTLDERETPRIAEELGCSEADLASHPDVQRRIDTAMGRANARLARFEQVKRHAILAEDFSIEKGTLTPTMKIRRRVVEEKYAETLAALYHSEES